MKKTLKIYDPAMCCPTGVCGTEVDTKLVQLANFLKTLDKNLFEVERFGLTTAPHEYVSNAKVKEMLDVEGIECLPLFFLDDEMIYSKDYPSVPQLSSKIGLSAFVLKM